MNTKNTILLIIRLFLGGLILTKGYGKLTGIEGVTGYFASMGLSAWMAWAVAIGETLIGLAFILGAWVRVAAAGLIVIMAGVFYFAGHYNWMTISLFVGSVVLLVTGAGRFAICRPKAKTATAAPMTTATASVPPSSAPQM